MAKRLPPMEVAKYMKVHWRRNMMKALSTQKNNGVTEEGVVRPSSKEKGLELFGLGSQAPSEEQEKHEQKEEMASWLASAPPRCRRAQSEGHHSGGSPQCAA